MTSIFENKTWKWLVTFRYWLVLAWCVVQLTENATLVRRVKDLLP
jgi:hypothetical protein